MYPGRRRRAAARSVANGVDCSVIACFSLGLNLMDGSSPEDANLQCNSDL